MFYNEKLLKLKELKQKYFDETSAKKKEDYKKQIDALISKITNGHKEFDFEIYFSEIFEEQGGFDTVIANPPYVKEYTDKNAFNGLRTHEYYQGKMDLWYFFGSIGIDILHPDGFECFIAPNNWVSNAGASKFRNKIMEETQIIQFIDFGNFKVFDAAGIQTMVYLLKKSGEYKEYEIKYSKLLNDNATQAQLTEFLKSNDPTDYFVKRDAKFVRDSFKDEYIAFVETNIAEILEKISTREDLIYLSNAEVANGIHPHHGSVSRQMLQKLGSDFSVGDGIFLLAEQEKKKLKLTTEELSLLKPVYTSKELQGYCVHKKNYFWIIYTDSRFKDPKMMNKYPNLKKHLDLFKKVITSDNRPYGLHRSRDESFFTGEKIASIRKCERPTFSYTDFPCYLLAEYYVIKTDRVNLKYLTAVLNSALVRFWLLYKGKRQGNIYQVDKEPLVNIPIKKASAKAQEKIVTVVDKILSNCAESSPEKNRRKYEKQIDQLVYKLYGLTKKEIEIIENNCRFINGDS